MSFHHYPDLPAELRFQIRAIVIQDVYSTNNRLPYPHWSKEDPALYERQLVEVLLAPLACVNQEWREDLERYLFRKIHLHECPRCVGMRHGELEKFDTLVVGARRSYLKKLTLNFSLCYRPLAPDQYATHAMARTDPTKVVSVWWHDNSVFEVTHRLLDILKRWDLRELVHCHRLSVKLKVIDSFSTRGAHREEEIPSMERISSIWPSGTARDLTALPAVSFIDVTFNLVETSSTIKPSTLLGIYSTLPNLRTIKLQEHDQYRWDWSPSELLFFYEKLRDLSPSLKRLYIEGICNDTGLEREVITSLQRLISGLEDVTLSQFVVDPLLFFELLKPYHDNATCSVILPWQNLRRLRINGSYHSFSVSKTNDEGPAPYSPMERLFTSAGRAVAFMLSLEYCDVHTNFWPREDFRHCVSMGFNLQRMPRPRNQTGSMDTFCLQVSGYIPSREAVDIWKNSLIQRDQVLLNVTATLSERGPKDWPSWENAVEKQASKSLMDLEDLSLNT